MSMQGRQKLFLGGVAIGQHVKYSGN